MFAEKRNYLQGYVRVRLTGYSPERFLNLCSNHNILIWNLTYQNNFYEFNISKNHFFQLKPILKKTKTRLVISNKTGLPFLLHKYRKRKIFFISCALFGILLYLMSLFIWDIEIQGNSKNTDSTILQFLNEQDIYHGVLKGKLESEAIEELLRENYPDIIWISAKIEGTRLLIHMQENLAAESVFYESGLEEAEGFGNLIAEKNAVISHIFIRQGTPMVQVGETVEAGAVLVEGKLPIYNDSGQIIHYQYCDADADIWGITSVPYEDRVAFHYGEKRFTGREKEHYFMFLFQKWFRLPGGKYSFENQERIFIRLPLKLGENFYLPVVLGKELLREYEIIPRIYTKMEAEEVLQHKLNEFCIKLEQKGIQIIENNVMIEAEGNQCRAYGELVVTEPIGIPSIVKEIQQEGQETNESDGNNHSNTN